jgi:hypothetical protein
LGRHEEPHGSQKVDRTGGGVGVQMQAFMITS